MASTEENKQIEHVRYKRNKCIDGTTQFDVDKIIEKLLNVRSKRPGTLVELQETDVETICQTIIYRTTNFVGISSTNKSGWRYSWTIL